MDGRLDMYLEPRDFAEKKRPIIRECLEVIARSGINAHDAQNIPRFLYDAIMECNRTARGETPFKVYPREEDLFYPEQQP